MSPPVAFPVITRAVAAFGSLAAKSTGSSFASNSAVAMVTLGAASEGSPFHLVGEISQEASQTAGAQRPPSAALPCLKGNNSIDDDLLKSLLKTWQTNQKAVGKVAATRARPEKEDTEPLDQRWRLISSHYGKSKHVLELEVEALVKKTGIEKMGFLTLTFRDHVVCLKEAQRRFNSFTSNALRKRYPEMITTAERMASGRIHFHLLVSLAEDVKTGFDFAAVDNDDYRTANAFLRGEWAFLRKMAPVYGFGRTQLYPIKSTAKGIAVYVGKYIGKHISMRRQKDKGHRIVRYAVEVRQASVRFMWANSSRLWRTQLAAFAAARGIESYDELAERLGPSWAWYFGDQIMAFGKGPESHEDARGEVASPERVQYAYDARSQVYGPVTSGKPVLSDRLRAKLLAAGIYPDGELENKGIEA